MYDTATRVELVKKRVRELNGACVRRNITGTKIRIGVYIGETDDKYAFIRIAGDTVASMCEECTGEVAESAGTGKISGKDGDKSKIGAFSSFETV